jgi:hypothetical protein
MNKLFIIGLPRTGTTSISVAMLEQGYKVAHTAFTKRAFELADVVSDAPCFSDYKELDLQFPGSKFVYLDRDLERWVPSAQMLLTKMAARLDISTGTFSPVLKRSFNETFRLNATENPHAKEHLEACYLKHKKEVFEYFSGRDDFINLNLSHDGSLVNLLDFLGLENAGNKEFPHLNIGRHVSGWREFKHPNKVNPNKAGEDGLKYFDFK